jgi:hypothetical protein
MSKPAYNSIFSPLATQQIPHEHPRLFGSRAKLKQFAKQRPEAYRRASKVAREMAISDPKAPVTDFAMVVSAYNKVVSQALIAAIDDDAKLAREAIELVFREWINKPVNVGHVPFGGDVAPGAMVYDLCHEHWTDEEQKKFHAYFFENRDKNVDEEPSPFHDGWWGYKNWGLLLGCLAVMYETEKEPFMLYGIDREFRYVAADCLRLAGKGGGYAEGFYVNYYMCEWLMACMAMKECTGADYLEFVPEFYRQRAMASVFEYYPTIREHGTRRSICVGDGRGRFFKLERDRALAANRILVGKYAKDPEHQALNTFLLQTPHVGAFENSWMELLWFDPSVKKGDLKKLKLSHFSEGPGYVYARSSWEEDATYLFFKCGKRFTAHQHLDVGHFYIFKHEELAGEGGHYVDWSGAHDINYYLRTIAHNSMLIHDPAESFEFIRGADQIANDGGQKYPWPGTCFRHNGDGGDADQWRRHRELMDIADMLAFEDKGTYLYCAGDCSAAYSGKKLDYFTRQIVFIRPGTFVIFDRVKSKKPAFKKTWLLHAMKPPTGETPNLVVTNGKGRLFVQTVLPANAVVKLNQGEELYSYGGKNFPPRFKTGPEAECRIEVSPAKAASIDYFLHVLTATDADVESVPQASAKVSADKIVMTLGNTTITFPTASVGGSISIRGKKSGFAKTLA